MRGLPQTRVPRVGGRRAADDHELRRLERPARVSSSPWTSAAAWRSAMPKLKASVREFLDGDPRAGQVTVLGFNDNIFTLARKATSTAERSKAVERLGPWGIDCALRRAHHSHRDLGRQHGAQGDRHLHRRRGSGQPREPGRRGWRRCKRRRGDLHDRPGSRTSHENLKKVMQRLATPTGGRAVFTEKLEDLRGVVQGTDRRALQPVPARLRAQRRQARRHDAHDQGQGRRLQPGPRATGIPREKQIAAGFGIVGRCRAARTGPIVREDPRASERSTSAHSHRRIG